MNKNVAIGTADNENSGQEYTVFEEVSNKYL